MDGEKMPVRMETPVPEGLEEIAVLKREKTPVGTVTGSDTAPIVVYATGLYASFLQLPVPVVLLTLWLVGIALIGLCILTLYQLF